MKYFSRFFDILEVGQILYSSQIINGLRILCEMADLYLNLSKFLKVSLSSFICDMGFI